MVSKTKGRPNLLCRKLIQRKTLKDNGKMNGEAMIISHGSPNLCGVAILFQKGFDCTILSKFEDPLGSYLILKAAGDQGQVKCAD